ncbi:hypothetical protein CEXT_599681 [Caerostris extrusa]|uniref:Histone acetyltransferase n=1 Tax=Caerostris extrusa TaxID=172846 RepID=A0AAV4YAK9_CAEEX|nr:hypothetical protein CEXT_599681 [Caerostris extrusa]
MTDLKHDMTWTGVFHFVFYEDGREDDGTLPPGHPGIAYLKLWTIVQIAFRMGLKEDYFFHLCDGKKKLSLFRQRIGREKCSNYSTINILCYFASPDRCVNALILLTQAVMVNASCRRDYHTLMSRVKNKKE